MDTKIDSQIIFGVMVCTEGEQDNVSHMEACCGVWNSIQRFLNIFCTSCPAPAAAPGVHVSELLTDCGDLPQISRKAS